MFLMDACFILEWFGPEASERDWFSIVDRIGWNALHRDILNYILKLENQIPLFVLTTLLQLEFGSRAGAVQRLAYMLHSFDEFKGSPFSSSFSKEYVQSGQSKYFLNLIENIEKNPFHLLDLYRMVIKDLLTHPSWELSNYVDRDNCSGAQNINNDCVQQSRCINILTSSPTPELFRKSTHSADLLRQAGICFAPGKLEFRKRRPEKGTLLLPQIDLGD
ncbi:hypothetical protein SUGI_0699730 [Cryptomeria japonica]|nr:hypothetical protein SUGI_0699730 [Cryptomeria japonica]